MVGALPVDGPAAGAQVFDEEGRKWRPVELGGGATLAGLRFGG